MDIGQIAAAVVTALSPFAPFLLDTGQAADKKLAETMVQRGGEAAWKTAQSLWSKLTAHFGDDPVVKSAATMVADGPEDETRQTMLAEVLGARLQENPALAEELLNLLGGQKAVQQVLADRGNWVEDVTQRMKERTVSYVTPGLRIAMSEESVTLDLPPSLAKELSQASRELLVEILERGLRELKIERALEQYGQGKMSFGATAREAGVSQSELARYAYARGMEPSFTDETVAEELS